MKSKAFMTLGAVLVATFAHAALPVTWDTEALSQTPTSYSPGIYPDDMTNGLHTVFLEGLPFKGNATRIFAYWGVPANATAENKVPAMVLVHGGGGSAYYRWVKFWVDRGFAAIAMDLCGCISSDVYGDGVNRRHAWAGPGAQGCGGRDLMDEANEDQWMYHAVAAVMKSHSFLIAQTGVDASRVGLTGVSWGGVVNSVTAAVDGRFKFAAPVYGCGFLYETFSSWTQRDGGIDSAYIQTLRAKWVPKWDPMQYLAEAKIPVLWLDGTNDTNFSLPSITESYKLVPQEKALAIRVRLGHSHGAVSEEAPEVLAAADHYLLGAPAKPQLGEPTNSDGVLTVALTEDAAMPAVSATIDYSLDDKYRWYENMWYSAVAELRAGQVRAPVPVGAKYAYLSVETANGVRTSTRLLTASELTRPETPAAIYVDAVNGNDDWNGLSATRGEGVTGPKKTLMSAVYAIPAGALSTIYAAEGTYDEGAAYFGSCSNRVVVPPGIGLEATGRRAQTIIRGHKSADEKGIGASAIRCVYLQGAGSYVKGFTITGGAAKKIGDYLMNGGGVYGETGSATIQCVIDDCAAQRGGGVTGGFYIGCYFGPNNAAGGSSGPDVVFAPEYDSQGFFNCIFDTCRFCDNYTPVVANCSFVGTSGGIFHGGQIKPALINSLIRSNAGFARMTNVVSLSYLDSPANQTTNAYCRFSAPAAKVALDAAYRPLATSEYLVRTGDAAAYRTAYDARVPAKFAAYRDVDFNGNARTYADGTMDIGACQYDWRTSYAETDGFAYAETDLGGGQKRVSFTRNFKSEKLLTALVVNGETADFEAHETGWAYEVDVAGGASSCSVVPVYAESQTTWYVDDDGDDGNKGYHPSVPKKTLKAAMALTKSGDVVYAAEGTYDEGETYYGSCSNRVVIPAGVGLEATGRRAQTVIKGYRGPVATKPDETSVRCVYLAGADAYVKGFTITDGAVRSVSGTSYCGGCVYGEDGSATIQCSIDRGYAARGGGVSGGVYIGCYLGPNSGSVAGGAPGATSPWGPEYNTKGFFNCIFDTCRFCDNTTPIALNCSFVGNAGGAFDGGSGSRRLVNSFVRSVSGTMSCENMVCVGAIDDATKQTTNAFCRFGVSASLIAVDSAYRPLATSTPLLRTGDAALYRAAYDQYVPAKFAAYRDVDYNGNARTYADGSIDIGACQYDWRANYSEADGFAYTETDLGGGQKRVSFTRNYKSEKLLTALVVNGETADFEAHETGWAYEVDVAGGASSCSVVPVYAENQTVWYVDDDGDDGNKGYHPSVPKKTLKAVMALTKSGDVVYAAEGTYDEGETYFSSCSNRVVVPPGVGLEATGRRAQTVIRGRKSADAKGMGASAVRCVYLRGAGAYVKGFTITGGAATKTGDYGLNGGGVYGESGSATIQCVIDDCAAQRGGGVTGGFCIGCYFGPNNAAGGSSGPDVAYAPEYEVQGCFNCIFDTCRFTDNYTPVVANCSFVGTSGGLFYGGQIKPALINSLIRSNSGSAQMTNVVSVSALSTDPRYYVVTTNAYCRFSAPAAKVALDAAYRPLATSEYLVRAGDAEAYRTAYDTRVPAKFAAYRDVDFNGSPRTYADGTMDIGACQRDWRAGYAETDGFAYTEQDIGGGQTRLSFTRNYKSSMPLASISIAGQTGDFTAHADGWTFVVDVAGNPSAYILSLAYVENQTTWYVDDDGDDGNTGYHPSVPKKTLKAVMARTKSGDTVYAAEGTYDEGETYYGSCSNRVVVPPGVGLEATGRRAQTIIRGHKSADEKGIGASAVRCVYLQGAGSYVKGFTITGGAAKKVDDYALNGGGVYGENGSATIQCAIDDCAAKRGGGVTGGFYIGCYFGPNNAAGGSVGAEVVFASEYDSQGFFNCVFDTCRFTDNKTPVVANCSFVGSSGGRFQGGQIGKPALINSFIRYNQGYAHLTNVVSLTEFSAADTTTTNAYCRFSAPVAKVALDAAYRPLATSKYLVRAGDAAAYRAAYDAHVPAKFSAYRDVDFNGMPRYTARGEIDIGACQRLRAGLLMRIY